MAIKTTEQLEGETTEVVSIHDDAIDADHMVYAQLQGYTLHLDQRWLAFKEGELPTVFVIGPISDEDAARRLEQDGLQKARKANVAFDEDARMGYVNEAFFRAGVRGIRGLGGRDFEISGPKRGIWPMPEPVAKKVPLSIQREIGAYIQRLTAGAVDVRPPREGEFDAESRERPTDAPEPVRPELPLSGEQATDLGK